MRATTLTYEAVATHASTEGLEKAVRFAKNVVLFIAAPFIGLAYALAFTFVGIGALAWLAVRALQARRAS